MKSSKKPILILLVVVFVVVLLVVLIPKLIQKPEPVTPEPTATVVPTETPEPATEEPELTTEEPEPIGEGKNFFTSLKLTHLDGTPFDASVFDGTPTLLNFWATWCPPCVGEMPHLNELAEEYKEKINIIGVQVDGLKMTPEGEIVLDEDKTAAAVKLQADQGLTFPLVNPDESLFILVNVPDYGVQVSVVPTTWLIDGNGSLRSIVQSAYDKEGWVKIIDQFLEDLTKLPSEEGNNEG